MTFNLELILHVSENVDLGSLSALAQTCKQVRSLIAAYEVSIVKARLRNRDQQPFLPRCGSILSSSTFTREVLRPHSFAVLRELALRQRRVDTLFARNSELMRAMERSTAFQALPRLELDRLVRGMKRACAAADRLADCAAEVMIRPDWCPQQRTRTRPEVDARQTRATQACDSYVVDTPRAVLARDARVAQLALLNTLSALDLALLYNLAAVAGMAYAETHPAEMADPANWEHVVAFQETFLRHGSAALWACCYPREAPASSWRGAKDAVVDEIHAWEMGGEDDAGMLPGLHMSLVGAFVKQSGRAKKRAGKEMERLVLNEIAG